MVSLIEEPFIYYYYIFSHKRDLFEVFGDSDNLETRLADKVDDSVTLR